MSRNVFDEMTASISEKERKELLKKINLSMNLNPGIDESIYHVDVTREEKEKLIRNEMEGLGFFERLIIKIKRLFSGKSEETIFHDMKFSRLKKYIQKKAPGITSFETRTISKAVAEAVYELSLKVSPLRDIFEEFWQQGETFHLILSELIESRISGTIKTIDDLISDEEAEKILYENETKNAIKNEVIRRFNSHVKDVPDAVFYEIEEEIMPLYYFRPVISFQYLQFLKLFGFNPYSENSSFSFKNAPVLGSLDYIEKLYYAIYMALKVSRPLRINSLIGTHFYTDFRDPQDFASAAAVEGEEETPAEFSGEGDEGGGTLSDRSGKDEQLLTAAGKKEEKNDDGKLKWFYARLNSIHDECRKISKKMPLVELIKYYRNDYYYRLAFYIPKLRLKEFYFANLKIRILEQVNGKYISARNMLIDRNIDKFFRGKQMKKFMHFRIYTSFDYEKMGVGYFAHLRSMELLYNFLIHYYNPSIRQIVDVTTRTILAQDKITANTIMMQISTIDDAFVKIQDFDNSLSPEMEDGKLFLRLRYGLGNDTAYLKMYKTFLMQKNKISLDLMQKTLEAFDAIVKNYTELLTSSLYEIRNSLSAQYSIGGRTRTFRDHLSEAVENIRYFKGLISNLLKVESGG